MPRDLTKRYRFNVPFSGYGMYDGSGGSDQTMNMLRLLRVWMAEFWFVLYIFKYFSGGAYTNVEFEG